MVRPMRKRDDNESEGEGKEDMAEEEASKEEEDRQSEPHQKTSSHHLNRKCLVGRGCSGYIGPNLKRHLQNVHVQKNHICEDVERYFAMGLDPKKRRGPRRKGKSGKDDKRKVETLVS